MLDNTSLDQLKDIILPSQFETGPPAVGWWLLSLGLSLTALLIVTLIIRYIRISRTQRAAIKALKQLPNEATLSAYNQILKRLALAYFPRQQVASLYGEAWLTFLDQQLKSKHRCFIKQSETWQILSYHQRDQALPEELQHSILLWAKKATPPKLLKQLFGFKLKSTEALHV